MFQLKGMSLDEAAGLKKQAETVVVEMVAKTSQINGSWNRHSVVRKEHLLLFNKIEKNSWCVVV